MQAAYKAVVSENFADVLHLGGGVYGENTDSTQTCLVYSGGAPAVHHEFLLGMNHFKGVCFSCYAGWYKADLPFEGEYDLENVGKNSVPKVLGGSPSYVQDAACFAVQYWVFLLATNFICPQHYCWPRCMITDLSECLVQEGHPTSSMMTDSCDSPCCPAGLFQQ